MQDLKIAAVQANLFWEQRQQNFDHLSELIRTAEASDLYVLPEMFSTGFSMNPSALAQEHPGEELLWLQNMAKEVKAVVCGSTMVSENGFFFNRFYWVRPDATFEIYDKRHLFSLAGEEKIFKGGIQNIQIELKGWKIRPQICYDLRFPVWSRNDTNYDLLLYVANWPEKRIHHWDALLVARAIENQSFVLGVNRFKTSNFTVKYKLLLQCDGLRLSFYWKLNKLIVHRCYNAILRSINHD